MFELPGVAVCRREELRLALYGKRSDSSPVLGPSPDRDWVFVDEFDELTIDLEVESPPWTAPQAAAPKAAAPKAVVPASDPTIPRKYPAKVHARKVAKELGVKDGLVYLPGLPTPLYEDSDMGPAFRQRRYFYYLGGADFEGCAVTYDIASDFLVLWVPYIDPSQILWYGTSPGPAECKKTIDTDDVRYIDGLDGYLHRRLDVGSSGIISASVGGAFCCERKTTGGMFSSTPTTLFVLHPGQTPAWLQGSDGTTAAASARPIVPVDTKRLLPAMDAARVTKTPYEIAMIRKANDVSSGAHRAVLHQLKGMTNEREIEGAFTDYCVSVHGAKHQAYPVIAGSGTNAAVLHYFANDQPLAGNQLVCLDASCEWDLYASDITRTFPISGRYTPEAAAVYAAVNRMQTEVIERFHPGVAYRHLHIHAALVAAEELLKLGVLRAGYTPRDVVAAGTIAAFFPHGLGHHVGLEVHDVLSSDLVARPPKKEAAIRKYGGAVRAKTTTAHKAARSQLGLGKRALVNAHMYATMLRDVEAEMAATAPLQSSSRTVDDKRRFLEPGMIITVEPGIYFCRPYIEAFYLSDPVHARFIDEDILEQFYPVGGVRIEDCILVTSDGHENLTTAPKGEEALRIINGKWGQHGK